MNQNCNVNEEWNIIEMNAEAWRSFVSKLLIWKRTLFVTNAFKDNVSPVKYHRWVHDYE